MGEMLKCVECGASFHPKMKGHVFCSEKCGNRDRERKRYWDNRELRLKQAKDYRNKNIDTLKKKSRERYWGSAEYRKLTSDKAREYRKDHPDRIAAANKRKAEKTHAKLAARIAHCLNCNAEFCPWKQRKFCCDKCRAAHYYKNNPDWYKEHREIYKPRVKAHMAKKFQELRLSQPWTILVRAAKGRASQKKWEFDLDLEWAKSRWTGRCEVSGIEFALGKRGYGPSPLSPTIDRIDNSIGYLKANCRFVIWAVNSLKHIGIEAEMLSIARAIADRSRAPISATLSLPG